MMYVVEYRKIRRNRPIRKVMMPMMSTRESGFMVIADYAKNCIS